MGPHGRAARVDGGPASVSSRAAEEVVEFEPPVILKPMTSPMVGAKKPAKRKPISGTTVGKALLPVSARRGNRLEMRPKKKSLDSGKVLVSPPAGAEGL